MSVESVLYRTWKPACATAWTIFIVYEAIIGFDKLNHEHPLCPHDHKNYPLWYWYICFGVLGAFIITFLLVVSKVSQIPTLEDKVPHLVACNIILIATIASILSFIWNWGGVCIDVLGVASPAAIWGEWIACGPLLVFVVVSLDNKPNFSRVDWMLMGSFFLCMIAGLLIIIPSSVALGIFWLVLSCLAYVPSMFLPCYCHPSNAEPYTVTTATVEDQAFLRLSCIQHTLLRRYHLAWALTIILPFFTVNYLIACGGLIAPAETIAIYQILSVLTKGFFTSITMDSHYELQESFRRTELESHRLQEARRAFLKYIFHELRSPLNSLSIGIDLLQSGGALQGGDVESVVLMKGASLYMTDILNNVLTIQKIEEGKLDLNMIAFSITDAVSRVSAVLHAAIVHKQIRLVVNVSPAVPALVLGDRYRIEHVIGNFLSNAIKFSTDDSEIVVEISVDTELERADSPDIWSVIRVGVRDVGMGISQIDQGRLFKNFVQIRPDQLQRGAGSGLGLTIAKQIVELHGGQIGVTSTEGTDHGSLFFFAIPFQQVAAATVPNHTGFIGMSGLHERVPIPAYEEMKSAAPSPSPSPSLSPPSIRVLVVDDSASILKMMKMLLKKFGVEADTADSGRAAVDIISLSVDPYQLVLMDNLMPEMNGLEATKLLRLRDFTGLIVGVTGHVFDDDVAAFLDAGADMVLAKPLSIVFVQMLLTFVSENQSSSEFDTLTYPSGGRRRRLVEQNRKFRWSI